MPTLMATREQYGIFSVLLIRVVPWVKLVSFLEAGFFNYQFANGGVNMELKNHFVHELHQYLQEYMIILNFP